MKVTIKKEVAVRFLQVEANVRYWEDSTVNGVEDTEDGDLIPCKEGGLWKPLIDMKTGIIENWEQGKRASVHYKVCDEGVYSLLEEFTNELAVKVDGYVPSIMSPGGSGFGDYIIMDINEDGLINKWVANLEDFQEEE